MLLDDDVYDDHTPELVITPSEKPKPTENADDYRRKSEKELKSMIWKHKGYLSTLLFKDNGDKVKATILKCEAELQRRRQIKLFEDYDDEDDYYVGLLDPRQEHNKLVENVSPMLDSNKESAKAQPITPNVMRYKRRALKHCFKTLCQKMLLDGELLVPKQEQCELAENVSRMSDSIGHHTVKTEEHEEHAWRNTYNCMPKKKRKVLAEAVDIITEQKEIDSGESGKEMNVNDDDSPEWAQALEPVRKLPTNVGSRIRRCIYESLNRNPPEWAREILEHSISKQVYKGNASGFTKRAVISVLEKVKVNIPQPKPTEKKEKEQSAERTLYEEELLNDDDGDVDDDDEGEEDGNDDDEEEDNEEDNDDNEEDNEDDDEDDEDNDDNEEVENEDYDEDSDDEEEEENEDYDEDDDDDDNKDDDVEKLSSTQNGIVCVQGYKVKRSTATIVEAIFKKHGDIAADCVFKSVAVRSSFLEVVCEVVRRIQTNDVIEMEEDINCQLCDAEAANINVSWIRAHFEAVHKRKEARMLMETKASITLVKKPGLMDLATRYEKLTTAYEQFDEVDRCMQVLHLVEKKLNNHILESKNEKDMWVKQLIL